MKLFENVLKAMPTLIERLVDNNMCQIIGGRRQPTSNSQHYMLLHLRIYEQFSILYGLGWSSHALVH